MEKETYEQKEQEKTLVFDVRLTRGLTAALIAALLMAACVGYLALSHQKALAKPAAAPAAGVTGLRQYYHDQNMVNGETADDACDAGYHMASLWEIMDTSNLEYNTDLGNVRNDSAMGPVTGYVGWVHTGYDFDTTNVAGHANCWGWSSSNVGDYGTTVNLPADWSQTTDIGTWEVDTYSCDTGMGVWCVED